MATRMDWTIEKKFSFIATHITTGKIVIAKSKTELMQKINAFEAENDF